MIVRILSRGTSFKGLSAYLTHDPDKAKTDERVGWTYTLNCAHDHVPSAVDEMLWTSHNAELLKQEAGIRAGGRVTENPVKHLSLNWSPDDDPTREHMIETAEDFLRHMGWQEHQAVLVAHEDKDYAHVHVMLNAVHPENGLRLDDNFERRRAQAWALDYEKENGRIYCEQRLLNVAEREDGPTRPAWMAFKNSEIEFQRDEKIRAANNPDYPENKNENPHQADWKRLKDIQRHERETFFAEGKIEFSELRKSVYRDVREEYRERWADFYAARKNGGDPETLASLKAELIADQKAALEERRDAACKELRENRNIEYRELLDDQRGIRHDMRARQEAGLDNAIFLERAADGKLGRDVSTAFRDTANEITALETTTRETGKDEVGVDFTGWHPREAPGMKSGMDMGANVSTAFGFGLISIAESIADGLVWSKPDPKPRQQEPKPPGPNLFETVITESRKHQQQQCDQEEADREWRRKQRSNEGE